MDFADYLARNYAAACESQRSFTKDAAIVSMLNDGRPNPSIVVEWMKAYAVLRGIDNDDRLKIADEFIKFAERKKGIKATPNRAAIAEDYTILFTALFRVVNRSWVSATSKLLWCIYPNDVVIYDSYVNRTITVMQALDLKLAGYPRVGDAPAVKTKERIKNAVEYYMNYQDLVKHVLAENADNLSHLRNQHREQYPYDIRIVDKLLWMIGNPKPVQSSQ